MKTSIPVPGKLGALLTAVPEIVELNVGHAIVSDAVIVGMDAAVRRFLRAMERS